MLNYFFHSRLAVNMKPTILCLTALILLCSQQFGQIQSAKILGVFPTQARSHFFVGQAVMKALHEAGHEITIISPFPKATPVKNWRDIETTEMIALTKSKIIMNILKKI